MNYLIVGAAAGLGLLLFKKKGGSTSYSSSNTSQTNSGGTSYSSSNTSSTNSGGGTSYSSSNTSSTNNGGGTSSPPLQPYSYRNSYWAQHGCNVWQLQIGVPIKRANRCTISFLQTLLGTRIANLMKYDGIWDTETNRVLKRLYADDPRYATAIAQATLENKTAQELFQILQTTTAPLTSPLHKIRTRLYQVTTPNSVSYNFQP